MHFKRWCLKPWWIGLPSQVSEYQQYQDASAEEEGEFEGEEEEV